MLAPIFAFIVVISVTTTVTSSMTSEERQGLESLQQAVNLLTRQLMMTQLAQEEMRRSDGDSGIKQVRLNRDGTRPYHCNTHSGPSVAAIHDHADMPGTCGMGEFEAVLNGVHFRTRHNDYPLRMPTSKGEYLGSAAVPFPPVPPAVLNQTSVEEQVEELRLWFRAWRDGDHSQRDYRQYFRPVICYLEGWWTTDLTLREPFHSGRHHVDAKSLEDLQEKIRFTSSTGDKNLEENLAFLPTAILNVTDGFPVLAQWTYRILCNPLPFDLKVQDLRPVDDFGSRLALKDTWEEYVASRSARFSLHPFPDEKVFKWTHLDKVMKTIPGLNGFGSRLLDRTFGELKLQSHNDSPLNTAYYHRWYKLNVTGAMGEKVAHAGFADRNLFVAETTQPVVAPVSAKHCTKQAGGTETCRTYSKRVTYAIPLEVVYLTPLHTWNPYGILYKGDALSAHGRTVTAGKRNGKLTEMGAFNGTNSKYFYHTPAIFFQSGKEVNSDPADTVKGIVGVLDESGKVRAVVASGVRIFLPEAEGLGVLRTRYPIMPVYAEGSTVWKEVEALRELVMDMQEHARYFRAPPTSLLAQPAVTTTSLPVPPSHTPSTSSASLPQSATERAHSLPAQETNLVLEPSKETEKGVLRQSILGSNNNNNNNEILTLSASQEGLAITKDIGSNINIASGRGLAYKTSKSNADNSASPQAWVPLVGYAGNSRQDSPRETQRRLPKYDPPSHVMLVTSHSTGKYVPLHVHYVAVSRTQLYSMIFRGKHVTLQTTLAGGHSHQVAVKFDRKAHYFVMEMCDGQPWCWDGHHSQLDTFCRDCSPAFGGKLRTYR